MKVWREYRVIGSYKGTWEWRGIDFQKTLLIVFRRLLIAIDWLNHVLFLLNSVHQIMKGLDRLLNRKVLLLLGLRGKFGLVFSRLSGCDLIRCVDFGDASLTFKGRRLDSGLTYEFISLGNMFCVFKTSFELLNGIWLLLNSKLSVMNIFLFLLYFLGESYIHFRR